MARQKEHLHREENPSAIIMTNHATQRARQRHFGPDEIEYVLQHGRRLYRSGVCFYFLAGRDVPLSDRKLTWVQRLVGATVVLNSQTEVVITLYKNGQSPSDICKKAQYRH